jgi:hypothetical protein
MYLTLKLPVPSSEGKITKKTINGTMYVYYELGREYNREKKYTSAKRVCIGKTIPDNEDVMVPNEKFMKYFPHLVLPEEAENHRSSCLRIGAYLVIRKIISEYRLDVMLARILGKDAGLFLDLAAYSIITENNAGQYYPEYAFNHPLLTENMKIYSDTKVSDFLKNTTVDQRSEFLNKWNEKRDHREKIYISYDSTNKTSQAGEIDIVEIGHPKVDVNKPIFNYSVAYDRNNQEPLFYESYPGSIVDISQLQYALEKAKAYGYRHVGFILDRGYFSKGNIHYMDANGYEFVLMVKGMKNLVSELILQVSGTFENNRANSIRAYKTSGTTVKRKLYEPDEKDRYFHIYYSDSRKTAEREQLESKIDRLSKKLKECMGMDICPGREFQKYFDLIYWHEGMEDQKFMFASEKVDVIDREIKLCGYFVIITSEEMTAKEALELYKSRDTSEKLFRGDKSYIGARSERVHSNEAFDTKIFVEFVASIIRCRMYISLKNEMARNESKQNFMTVPAAIRELEKIELIRGGDNEYHLDHSVTATQKAILKAFEMTSKNVIDQAREISSDLSRIEAEEIEKEAVRKMA